MFNCLNVNGGIYQNNVLISFIMKILYCSPGEKKYHAFMNYFI